MFSWMWSSENDSSQAPNTCHQLEPSMEELIPETDYPMPREALYYRDRWSPTDEETKKAVIAHFQDRLDELDEDIIVRYVRGYHYQDNPLQASLEALEIYLQTHESFSFSTILETQPEFDPQIFNGFQLQIHGCDRFGHPVLYIKLNSEWFEYILREESVDEDVLKMKRYVHYFFQLVSRKKKEFREKYGIMMYKHVTVLDVENLGLSVITTSLYRNLVISLIQEMQKINAEAVYRVFIVNTSSFFSLIANIFLPILDEKTREKVCVATAADAFDLMKQEISEDNIPTTYGGRLVPSEFRFGVKEYFA